MSIKTITIGGGNKFSFLFYPSLEIIIIYVLKRNKNNIHYHIGNLPLIRRIFLDILLFLNFIPKKRFKYIGQTENIEFIKDINKSLVISSIPFVGLLTIFKCWSFGIPVLIFNPVKFYINFEPYIDNQNLQFKNLNDIENIINFAEENDNYQTLVKDTKKYFDYLNKDKSETYNLLVNRAKKLYKERYKNKITLNLNFFLRLISIHFKFLYILIRLVYILFSNYIAPIFKR